MLYTEFDPDKYEELLINEAFDNPESLTNMNKGHTKPIHTGLTDSQLFERIAREDKNTVSSFTDLAEYPVLSRIGDAIVNQAPVITDWACSKRNEFNDVRDYNRLTISVNLNYDEPIGTGFNDKLEKYVTDTIKVVLQRDLSGENSFGFFVLTAYPDIEKGIPTGEKYEREEVIKNCKNLSVLEKVKFGIKNKDIFVRISPDKYTGINELCMFHRVSPNESYATYLSETKLRIVQHKANSSVQISKNTLMSADPEMYKTLEKAELLKTMFTMSNKQQTKINQKPKLRAENLQH